MLRELYLKKKTLKSKKKRHSENRIFLSMAMISTICGLVRTQYVVDTQGALSYSQPGRSPGPIGTPDAGSR